MKPNLIFAAILLIFLSYGCSQPVGSSLLTNGSSNSEEDDSTTDSGATDGPLEISSENTELVLNVEESDKIEVTGKCVDLDRRKNRIIVEVFAGEDENATPYISNAISDLCQTAEAGLLPGETCFWVTKGIGIVEGPPVSRSFPQCHDGAFGFAVKLGKVLVSGATNLKYTIRFKLRTLDGILSDSQWGRVSVTRTLVPPSLDKITANDFGSSCLIEGSPARFNQEISYMLTKTGAGNGAVVPMGNVYPSRLISSLLTPNSSVYSWEDKAGIIAGATFTYSLDSRHETPYLPNQTRQFRPQLQIP